MIQDFYPTNLNPLSDFYENMKSACLKLMDSEESTTRSVYDFIVDTLKAKGCIVPRNVEELLDCTKSESVEELSIGFYQFCSHSGYMATICFLGRKVQSSSFAFHVKVNRMREEIQSKQLP